MKRFLIPTAFMAIIFLCLASTPFAGAQDITGDWQGPLTTPMGELRLVLHITKAADGTLKATLDSPDQGVGGVPVDSINVDGNKVHFVVTVIKGNFDGSLKGNGSINGNWMQGVGSQKMPLVLSKTTTPIKMTHDPAPPSDIDGTWEGLYDTPTGGTSAPDKNHVTFHIKNTADGLTATVDLPDMMNIKGWPATSVTRKGSSIKIAVKQVNTVFSGKINKSLDAMTGDWLEGDSPARALNLKKTKEEPTADAQKPDAQKK
jgi:acid stress-induced BolA-like protein IbaG/YrbA